MQTSAGDWTTSTGKPKLKLSSKNLTLRAERSEVRRVTVVFSEKKIFPVWRTGNHQGSESHLHGLQSTTTALTLVRIQATRHRTLRSFWVFDALKIEHYLSYGQIPLASWETKLKTIWSLRYLYTRRWGTEICAVALPQEGMSVQSCSLWMQLHRSRLGHPLDAQ